MKKEKKLWIGVSILSLFIGALVMYIVVYYYPLSDTTINKLEKEITVTDVGISDAVDKLYDAVVVVSTYKNDTQIASGSGFVYKEENDIAYILTNSHVIDGGSKIEVTFSDGNTYEVKLVGSEEYSDIAVLSIDASKIIMVAEIGSSEDMKLGDTVFTIGAPIGSSYSGTVTRGILSGKDRMVEVSVSSSYSSDYVMKVIQTDAAINSGNSGGPLANSNGEVIGITSLKLVSDGVEGIGFAIPIEDAVYYATLLEENGKIERPYLGVSMLDTSDKYILYRYGIQINNDITGVVIVDVEKNSPADLIGLKSGDVVTKIAGEEITSVAEFKYELYKHAVGDTVEIEYIRNSETKTGTVKLVANE